MRPRFHLAFPVADLPATRAFYVDLLGARVGRSAERWIDFDFWGHQLSAHLVDNGGRALVLCTSWRFVHELVDHVRPALEYRGIEVLCQGELPNHELLARKRSEPTSVLVGTDTASSAEVLAALLQRYAGGCLAGARTAGKDHLTRVIAVDHDWRLLVPAERIEVPGVDLSGGLRPVFQLSDFAPPERQEIGP